MINVNLNKTPGGTNFVPAKCTFCGTEQAVDPTQQCTVCHNCGKAFITKNAIQNYNSPYQNGAFGQHVSSGAQQGYSAPQQFYPQSAPPKKKHTVWWILGWIFCFPIPLTILISRSHSLGKSLKIGLIAAAWIVYLIIFFPKGTHRTTDTRTLPEPERPAVTTTVRIAATEPTTEATTETTASTTEITETAAESETNTETAVQETGVPANSDVSFADVKRAVDNGDYSLVTPEFKATMDAYEAFYDQYIAFMKKYTSGQYDIMGMLNDYTEMIAQMDEWSRKIDAIDETKLSPADDAYYLLVTLRIEQKLIGAMLK